MPFRELYSQTLKTLHDLSPGKKIALLVIVGGTILSLIILMIWSGTPDYQLLYSNLTPEDAGAIVERLKDQKIAYRISSSGSSILVPREKIYETRLELASKGLPQGSNVGFEIFDKTKLGMTEFVQNVNYQRALQGELSRTINGFSEVESSRVHIVLPSKSLFIEEEKPATASVVLKLHPRMCLARDQVQAIVHLLSSSISGLEPGNVTIVDTSGKMLTGFRDRSTAGQVSAEQLELQEKVEKSYESRIKSMLESALGPEKAIVRVSCSLDFKRREKTEETYNPEQRVIRSEQVLNENSTGVVPLPVGIPGVLSNIPEAGAGVSKGQNANFQKQDKTVNYEISKVTSHIVEPVGAMDRISVAVIVDGTYRLVTKKAGAKEDESGEEAQGEQGKEWTYFPRTSEEMEKLENIVKRAVNFDPQRGDKVEVVNIPFETTRMPKGEEELGRDGGWISALKNHPFLVKFGFLGVFLILAFVFVIRPLVRWLTSGPSEDLEIIKQLPKTVGEIESEYGRESEPLPFRGRVLELLAKDREHSIELMRNWLREG